MRSQNRNSGRENFTSLCSGSIAVYMAGNFSLTQIPGIFVQRSWVSRGIGRHFLIKLIGLICKTRQMRIHHIIMILYIFKVTCYTNHVHVRRLWALYNTMTHKTKASERFLTNGPGGSLMFLQTLTPSETVLSKGPIMQLNSKLMYNKMRAKNRTSYKITFQNM